MISYRNKKKQLYWINCTKAISMLCVYLQHTITLYGFSSDYYNPRYIGSFYVNAFFMVSGYLFFWKKLKLATIEDKFERLGGAKFTFKNLVYGIAIPSIIFSCIEFFPKKIIRGEPFGIVDFVYETIGGGTYWFTSALFVAELILLMLLFSKKSNIWFYVLICILLAYIGQNDNLTSILTWNEKYIWHWASGFVALFFMAIGGVYMKFETIIDRYVSKIAIIIGLVFLWIVIINVPGFEMKFAAFNRALNFEGAVAGALGSLLVVILSKKMPYISSLDWLGTNSLVFYFLSGAVPTVFSILFIKLDYTSSFVGFILVYLLSVFTAFGITKILKKYFIFLFDIRTIWRKS